MLKMLQVLQLGIGHIFNDFHDSGEISDENDKNERAKQTNFCRLRVGSDVVNGELVVNVVVVVSLFCVSLPVKGDKRIPCGHRMGAKGGRVVKSVKSSEYKVPSSE